MRVQKDLGVRDRGGVLSAQVSSLIGKGGAHVGWAGCAAHSTRARCALAMSTALCRKGHIKCAPARPEHGAPDTGLGAIVSHSPPFSALPTRILAKKTRFYTF